VILLLQRSVLHVRKRVGIRIGLAGASAMSRALQTLLFGIGGIEPWLRIDA